MARRKLLKDAAFGRGALKLVSLVLAFILWFYVLNSRPMEVEKRLMVVYIAPKGLVLATEVPREINVTFRGPRAFLQAGLSNIEKVYVNLNSPTYSGRRQFNLQFKKTDVPLPLGVDVVRINPGEVRIQLAPKSQKKVPVLAQLVGEVPSDFRLVSYQITPKHVSIEGPMGQVKQVTRVQTMPVDLQALTGPGSMRLSVVRPSPGVSIRDEKNPHVPLEDVLLEYDVRPKKANFILKNVEIRFLTSKQKFHPSQRFAAVSVLAKEGAEKTLTRAQVQVIADIPDGARGKVKVELRAELPGSVHLLQIHPRYINVVVD